MDYSAYALMSPIKKQSPPRKRSDIIPTMLSATDRRRREKWPDREPVPRASSASARHAQSKETLPPANVVRDAEKKEPREAEVSGRDRCLSLMGAIKELDGSGMEQFGSISSKDFMDLGENEAQTSTSVNDKIARFRRKVYRDPGMDDPHGANGGNVDGQKKDSSQVQAPGDRNCIGEANNEKIGRSVVESGSDGTSSAKARSSVETSSQEAKRKHNLDWMIGGKGWSQESSLRFEPSNSYISLRSKRSIRSGEDAHSKASNKLERSHFGTWRTSSKSQNSSGGSSIGIPATDITSPTSTAMKPLSRPNEADSGLAVPVEGKSEGAMQQSRQEPSTNNLAETVPSAVPIPKGPVRKLRLKPSHIVGPSHSRQLEKKASVESFRSKFASRLRPSYTKIPQPKHSPPSVSPRKKLTTVTEGPRELAPSTDSPQVQDLERLIKTLVQPRDYPTGGDIRSPITDATKRQHIAPFELQSSFGASSSTQVMSRLTSSPTPSTPTKKPSKKPLLPRLRQKPSQSSVRTKMTSDAIPVRSPMPYLLQSAPGGGVRAVPQPSPATLSDADDRSWDRAVRDLKIAERRMKTREAEEADRAKKERKLADSAAYEAQKERVRLVKRHECLIKRASDGGFKLRKPVAEMTDEDWDVFANAYTEERMKKIRERFFIDPQELAKRKSDRGLTYHLLSGKQEDVANAVGLGIFDDGRLSQLEHADARTACNNNENLSAPLQSGSSEANDSEARAGSQLESQVSDDWKNVPNPPLPPDPTTPATPPRMAEQSPLAGEAYGPVSLSPASDNSPQKFMEHCLASAGLNKHFTPHLDLLAPAIKTHIETQEAINSPLPETPSSKESCVLDDDGSSRSTKSGDTPSPTRIPMMKVIRSSKTMPHLLSSPLVPRRDDSFRRMIEDAKLKATARVAKREHPLLRIDTSSATIHGVTHLRASSSLPSALSMTTMSTPQTSDSIQTPATIFDTAPVEQKAFMAPPPRNPARLMSQPSAASLTPTKRARPTVSPLERPFSEEQMSRLQEIDRRSTFEILKTAEILRSTAAEYCSPAVLQTVDYQSPRKSKSKRTIANITPQIDEGYRTAPIEQTEFAAFGGFGGGRLSIDFDQVISQWEASSPTTDSRDSRESFLSIRSSDIQGLRKAIGLPLLRDQLLEGEPKHPNHPYAWNTVKVMCRRIHVPEGKILPEPPELPHGIPVSWSEQPPSYFEATNPSVIEPPQRCHGCDIFCCHYARLIAHSSGTTTDIIARAAMHKLELEAFNLRKLRPCGVEEYDTFLECSHCHNLFCPNCSILCAEELCREAICRWCRDATGLCQMHNFI